MVTIFEMQEFGKAYAAQIVKNSNVLAQHLADAGLEVRKATETQYTYNHQIHVFSPIDRIKTVQSFLDNNISLGTSGALGDRLFMRIGTQEVTRRGYTESDMREVACLIKGVLEGTNVKREVAALIAKRQNINYGYSAL